MSTKPLVSVIVPVYNVDKYLNECLDSVTQQTYKKIEIILVDDGSTDKSGAMCDAWAKKDERVKVIHKNNEGLNYARKDGFKKSSGEYVTFLDSDDLFHKKNVELSLKEAIDNKADIISYTFTKFSDNDSVVKLTESNIEKYERRILKDKKSLLEYVFLEEGVFPGCHAITAWGKLYNRAVVETVDWTMSNYRSYEDNFWTPQLFAVANKAVLLSCQLSFYRRNGEYGVQGNTLGNRLTGNTRNGESVGYVELIDTAFSHYIKIAKKYDVDIERKLYDKRFMYMKGRFDNLVNAGLVSAENNLDYIKEVWTELNKRYTGLEQQNRELRDSNEKLKSQNEEFSRENDRLKQSLSWRITKPLRLVMRKIRSII